MKRGVVGLALLGVFACGDEPSTAKVEPAAAKKGPDGWTELWVQPWTVQPGVEDQPSYSETAERDWAITAIRAVDPAGTHHVDILGPGPVHNVLFVSVIGTGPFFFPPGVGLRIRKDDALTLLLHVVNATDHVVEGASGFEVMEATEPSAFVEANILTPAVTSLTVPPGTSQAGGHCTLTSDQTLFAIAPHMHKFGSRIRSTLTHGTSTHVLLDQDFSWTEQVFVPIEPVQAHAGDTVTVDCTWKNTSQQTVHWGTTSDKEMCSVFVYRYPAGDSNFCTK